MQRWWNLSKLVRNTFINFGNSFNSIIISPFLLRKKYLQKTLFGSNEQFSSAWKIMIKAWERVLLRPMIKNKQIQFFDSQMYFNNLNTITLKLFHNHEGIYRFRKKFKKDSGEINPLLVHRNMRMWIFVTNCKGLGW